MFRIITTDLEDISLGKDYIENVELRYKTPYDASCS